MCVFFLLKSYAFEIPVFYLPVFFIFIFSILLFIVTIVATLRLWIEQKCSKISNHTYLSKLLDPNTLATHTRAHTHIGTLLTNGIMFVIVCGEINEILFFIYLENFVILCKRFMRKLKCSQFSVNCVQFFTIFFSHKSLYSVSGVQASAEMR